MSDLKRCTKCNQTLPWNAFRMRGKRPRSWCRACEASDAKQYRQHNPEKFKETKRKYYVANRDRLVQECRERHQKNLERDRELCRQWAKNNPEQNRMRGHRRRARIASNGGDITAREWEEVKQRFGNRCLCCGLSESERPLTMDHVIPIAMGGKHVASNLQPLCKPCNSRKKDRHIDYRNIEAFHSATEP